MNELKPCPFCGGTNIGECGSNTGFLGCCCLDCGVTGERFEGDVEQIGVWEKAFDAWNTRVLDPRIAKLEAEVECLREQLDGKWLPIATAPKDGSSVLSIWNGNARRAFFRGDRWRSHIDTKMMCVANQPTYWQPLPPVLISCNNYGQ